MLVSGMGSELGSLVATKLEAEPWVGALEGIDVDPPRRRLRRAMFHRIDPHDRERVFDVVRAFDPHIVVHIAVWEPNARANTSHAQTLTNAAAVSILGAAAECPSLEHTIVRSAAEIYGRGRGALTRPDEDAPPSPTSTFGRMAAMIESTAGDAARRTGTGLGAVRLAPVLGRHVPSPLGRLLRLPAVPFSALADPPFGVVHDHDAADALVAAARTRLSEPVNVTAPGAITALQALLRGRRVPIPLLGPEWAIARRISNLAGAPIPDHVAETMHRGRLIDGSRAQELLGVAPTTTTAEVIDTLYAWPSVIHIPAQPSTPAEAAETQSGAGSRARVTPKTRSAKKGVAS
ncbi:MAG TPA: NAD-dependent epimerase/dehydratase family protein [Ilumatobacteraceae bacterium]|nr:NAD-dependent epimerase/dehydratase family protein [Ilumatobacteraceae bacterium]